jgi:hypothetical protein
VESILALAEYFFHVEGPRLPKHLSWVKGLLLGQLLAKVRRVGPGERHKVIPGVRIIVFRVGVDFGELDIIPILIPW